MIIYQQITQDVPYTKCLIWCEFNWQFIIRPTIEWLYLKLTKCHQNEEATYYYAQNFSFSPSYLWKVHFMKFVFVTFYEICYLNDTSSSWVLAGSHFKKTPESLASIWFNQIFDLGPLQQIQCHYAISGFLKIWVGWSWKTTKKENILQ